ncbi:nuclear transport factor 2 family protein [Hufsiella ginkgonis]|uniref:Nuclear transport factor 2 family protein n=1 Tax=Hufsiella ginkgonis TaxID=2695274 RepID=A0A7K1XZ69_9SPHI|nr:nuclear transport factor 2 family protein [Hufsiella ginkgonis]MXV16305.1 hypothetical protein [Hufsiella ginkgonis]
MKKRALLLLTFSFLFSVTAFAQSPETDAVKKVINTLFEGMRKGDSALVKTTFAPGMVLQTIPASLTLAVKTDDPASFLKAVGAPHPAVWDERITFNYVLIDGRLASVWTNYKFYTGDQFSHCGVNSFQLVKGPNGWKIVYLVDTRRKDECPG